MFPPRVQFVCLKKPSFHCTTIQPAGPTNFVNILPFIYNYTRECVIMADLKEPDTALCIIPPRHLWPQIDRVRSRHDKKFPNWPPHIKLIYPFEPVQRLKTRMEAVSKAVEYLGPIRVRLEAPDLYHEDEHRQAIFLHVDDANSVDEDGGGSRPLDRLCEAALESAQPLERGAWYRSMIVGHALVDESADGAESLLLRASLLSGLEWEVDELHVLVREGLTSEPRPEGSRMIHWATISLTDGGVCVHQKRDTRLRYCVMYNKAVAGRVEVPGVRKFYNKPISPKLEEFSPYSFDGVEWRQSTPSVLRKRSLSATQSTFAVASYNVLGRTDDFPILIENILHNNAEADVLVLQETTHSFLSHLLHNKRIQERFAFCTHRPISRSDDDALPSQEVVVVLSRYAFCWEIIPLPQSKFEPDHLNEHEKDHDSHYDIENDDAETLLDRPTVEDSTRTHSRALLLEFRKNEDCANPGKRQAPLALAAFHLTPGWYHESYHARARELDAIKHYIFSGTPAVLAGGFNMPTSSLTLRYSGFQGDVRQVENGLLSSGYIDAWLVAKMTSGAEADNDPVPPEFQGEQGCTNGAALHGTVSDDLGHQKLGGRPQRLDRIMVKPHGSLVVQSFNKFGNPAKAEDDAPSDISDSSGISKSYSLNSVESQPPTSAIRDTSHKLRETAEQSNLRFGVRAVVQLGRGSSCLGNVSVADDSAPSVASHLGNGLPTHLKGHGSVLEALRDAHGIPLLGECQLRVAAFEVLKIVLCGPFPSLASSEPDKHGVDLVIVPVGSYGLGVWTSSSGLDCMCIGSFSLPTFIDLATQRIRQAPHRGIRLIRKRDTYMGTILELDVRILEDHLRVDLTYGRRERSLSSSELTRPLASDMLTASKAFRDLKYVKRSVPDLVAFRLAHRFVKRWAEIRGIYSAKFGYLGGIQITILLTRVHKRLATKIASPTVPEILFTFFKEYASFNWKKNVVLDKCFHKDLSYSRTSREPLAILSYFPPRLNTSPDATASTVRTIISEFQRAEKIVDQQDGTWADLLKTSTPSQPTSGLLAADEFLERHQNYIKISAEYWDGSTTKGRGFVGWVENRCVSLLADLKHLTNVHTRIWPTRYTEEWRYLAEKSEWAEDWGEYRGVFFIGLDCMGQVTGKLPGAMRHTLETILFRFEQQVRREERHFDSNSMGIRAELIRAANRRRPIANSYPSRPIKDFRIDDRDWDAYMQGDEDSEDEGELQGLGQATTVQGEWHASSKNKKKPATNQPRSASAPKPEGAGKFRTAADVLNRLRWDASYDHNDFVVGYEDRFLGAMERGLDLWKSEQTHEEFIPQHRILYFKRSSDGVVVWERRTRTDLVFGSG